MKWLAWHVIGGYARRHPIRAIVQLIAIAVGVALGYGVHLVNTSALDEFGAAVRSVSGEADASITATRTGFDERVFGDVLASPTVALASPVVEVDVSVLDIPVLDAGRSRAPMLTIVGIDALRAAEMGATLLPAPGDRASRFAPFDDGVFLSAAALEQFKRKVGDDLKVRVGTREVSLRIVGSVPGARAGQSMGVMDIGFAQWRLDRLGRLTRIDLRLAPGASAGTLASQLTLPPGVAITTPDAESARVSNLSRAYRVNLNVLALVALFTGAFLVFSLQAQATLARRSQLAYLRVIGVTAGQLQRLLMVEAAALGIVGSALGIALGALIAELTLRLLGGDLGSGFFAGTRPELRLAIAPALGFIALGIAAAIIGSWIPARDAARTPPALALKPGAEEDAVKPLGRLTPPLVALLAAALFVWLPPINGLPIGGYLSIAAVLIGVIALQPRLARTVFVPLARRIEHSSLGARFPMLLLATTRIAQAPGFAAIGMAGIVASFALMIAMATMVSSFRTSVDQWLERVLPAELYLRVAQSGSNAYFSDADRRRIVRHPGVARADFSRSVRLQLDPQRAPVALIARPVDAANPTALLPLTGVTAIWKSGMAPPVWISEAMVDIYGMHVGDTVTLPLASGQQAVRVMGVWRDYARQFGSVVMRSSDYEAMTGDLTVTDAALWLAAGRSAPRIAEELRTALDAGAAIEFAEPGELRRLSLRIFDRSFAITYVLEIVAIFIGLVGIAATFSSQALSRTREFGMLRHLGLTRAQILQLLAIEGTLVTALSVAVGLVSGLVVSVVLIRVINPQSFYWTMDFDVPRVLIVVLMAALMVAAVITAIVAGRRAVSIEAVRAVSEDW